MDVFWVVESFWMFSIPSNWQLSSEFSEVFHRIYIYICDYGIILIRRSVLTMELCGQIDKIEADYSMCKYIYISESDVYIAVAFLLSVNDWFVCVCECLFFFSSAFFLTSEKVKSDPPKNQINVYLFHLLVSDFASSATDTNQTKQRKSLPRTFQCYIECENEKSENGKDYFNTRKRYCCLQESVIYCKSYHAKAHTHRDCRWGERSTQPHTYKHTTNE